MGCRVCDHPAKALTGASDPAMTPHAQGLPQKTRTCNQGHVYDTPKCLPCKRAYVKQWRKDNPDRLAAQRKKYNAKSAKRLLPIRTQWKRDHPERDIWGQMIQRCSPSKALKYPGYAGRGITVCDRWSGEDGFSNFLSDMGPRPGKEYSIERMNNDLGYSPENCKWATKREQARNTRRNHYLTLNGRSQCLTAWAIELGVNMNALRSRLRMGWSVEDVLTIPVKSRR